MKVLNTFGCWRRLSESSRPHSRLSRTWASAARKVGFCADSCSPARPRMIGTPALSSVCIWRQNSIRSESSTFGSPKENRRPAPGSAAAAEGAASMCTGVMPVLKSWSATAPLFAPSRTPFTSSPRALRPW